MHNNSQCRNPPEDNISCDFATKAADLAAEKAVERVFYIFGVDVHKPEAVEDFRKSLRFSDYLRKVADKSGIIFMGTFVALLASALITGIVIKIKGG